eukprot:TRINITY_DN11378_c1_g3_i1.p2 TRINITY_DN11378_c1_g3~~TRINITY_DN11378_c1_g3_i1.p2  ORF type:complete len:226 (+),score=19.09 TRINITY_DN11378_c1_g3_i1:5070-5747(+)
MPQARQAMATFVFNNQLWIVGGHDNNGVDLKSVLVYGSMGWFNGPELPLPRSWAAHAVFNNEMYVIGGEENDLLARATVYIGDGRTWRSGPSLRTGRDGARAHVFAGQLLVFGGEAASALDSTEVLSNSTGPWEAGPDLTVSDWLFACCGVQTSMQNIQAEVNVRRWLRISMGAWRSRQPCLIFNASSCLACMHFVDTTRQSGLCHLKQRSVCHRWQQWRSAGQY